MSDNTVPAGKRSGLVAQALENELRRRRRLEQVEGLQRYQNKMFDKYGQLPASAADIELMRQERDDEQSGVQSNP